jgi:hypothetical protein
VDGHVTSLLAMTNQRDFRGSYRQSPGSVRQRSKIMRLRHLDKARLMQQNPGNKQSPNVRSLGTFQGRHPWRPFEKFTPLIVRVNN